MFNSLKMLATNSFLLHFISVRTASSTHWLWFFTFDRISPYPSMLHKYASESKWEDAIRLCRFVKVKKFLFLWCSQCLYTVLKVWYFFSLEKNLEVVVQHTAASHLFYAFVIYQLRTANQPNPSFTVPCSSLCHLLQWWTWSKRIGYCCGKNACKTLYKFCIWQYLCLCKWQLQAKTNNIICINCSFSGHRFVGMSGHNGCLCKGSQHSRDSLCCYRWSMY